MFDCDARLYRAPTWIGGTVKMSSEIRLADQPASFQHVHQPDGHVAILLSS